MDEQNISFCTGDVAAAASVMREAAAWLIDAGKTLWKPADLTAAKLLQDNTKDEFHVLKIEDAGAAAMILQWEDRLFWPDVKRGESGFIHKLSVRRKYAGTGISVKMIQHAVSECRRRNIAFLRLDCAADRDKLCGFYENFGFKRVARRMVGEFDVAFYEYSIR